MKGRTFVNLADRAYRLHQNPKMTSEQPTVYHRHDRRRWQFGMLCVVLIAFMTRQAESFTTLPGALSAPAHSSTRNAQSSTSQLHAKPKKKQTQGAEFEYQELKLNLRSMKEQKLTTANQIVPEKRVEIEGYVRQIVRQRPQVSSSILSKKDLVPSTWRLAFSTQSVTNESLPPGVTVLIKFQNDSQLDYVMEFTKTLGLSQLTAQSNYSLIENNGWLTYTYDKITTDFMGMKNVGVPFGGILQGRSTTITTTYFDGELWIEQGVEENGAEYFNVYTLEVTDDWQSS
mmetsp:Transcript_110227/g.318593  ORF Transcript_110227/g.318593 Transcript_110227/m.318593 type:complete len:287 (-) Transcript_110227:19-879(-)